MKYVLSLALALFFCIVIIASPHASTDPCKIPAPGYTVSAAYGNMANEILVYVNEYRRKKGLPKLEMNNVVSAEAQKHSENMAARRTPFGHNGFQGRWKRLSSALSGISEIAENVALGSTTAKEVVDNWLKSPMHRENIEGRYKITGIGIAADKKGVLYFTQIFAAN